MRGVTEKDGKSESHVNNPDEIDIDMDDEDENDAEVEEGKNNIFINKFIIVGYFIICTSM